jgi:hypothetical protein
VEKDDAVERDDIRVDESVREKKSCVDKVEKLELKSVVKNETG